MSVATDYKSYLADLTRRWHDYAASRFPADMLDPAWTRPDGPVVFRPGHADRNVVVSSDANHAAAVLAALPSGARHRWFRSMRSSQALTQSVFGGLAAQGRLHLLARVLSESGSPAFPSGIGQAAMSLEKSVTWLGEPRPTSVDVWFDTGRHLVAVECKLTEPEFGSCSRPSLSEDDPGHCDGSYRVQRSRTARCSLTEIGVRYWTFVPDLFIWDPLRDHQPCPLQVTYQLVRNVMAATVFPSGTADPLGRHALVVYDRHNPAFAPGGPARQALDTVHAALRRPEALRVVSWQAIVAQLREETDLGWLVHDLAAKYGLEAEISV